MERRILTEPADLIDLIAEHCLYQPTSGSVVVMDSQVQPIAVLTRDLLRVANPDTVEGFLQLVSGLAVFHGRDVFLVGVGKSPLAQVKNAVEHAGGRALLAYPATQSEVATKCGHLPSRERLLRNDPEAFSRFDEQSDRITNERWSRNDNE